MRGTIAIKSKGPRGINGEKENRIVLPFLKGGTQGTRNRNEELNQV